VREGEEITTIPYDERHLFLFVVGVEKKKKQDTAGRSSKEDEAKSVTNSNSVG